MSLALAIIAAIAALNPPRRSLELGAIPPRAVTAAGVGLAGAVFVGVAALSGPLLGWLDISDPNIRIAAGLVVGIRALVDVVVAPRPEVARWPGRTEAVVPVAVPTLLRPEVAVLALSVGADRGPLGATITAAAAFAATLGALLAWPPSRWHRLAALAVSAVAVVVAIDLIIDGVLDI